MYKVYHDPEGNRYLDKGSSHLTEPDFHSTSGRQFSEDDYKKKIKNLNIEIKGLNEELVKVSAWFFRALFNFTI